MKASKIEWTDSTWNPVRGCSLVSAGCTNCYAMKMAYRFSGPGLPYEGLTRMTGHGPVWNGKIMLVPDVLDVPLHTKRPTKFFVNSMSDLFHEDVPFEFIDKVFAVMAFADFHTFQVLTKRPERMIEYMKRPWDKNLTEGYPLDWPLPNVWLGVSVENQKTANERIPLLLQVPSAIRFLSMEPLLGPVDLHQNYFRYKDGSYPFPYLEEEFRTKWLDLIHWVIVGGESGPGARPMHPDWVRSIRDQCESAGVPFFFKQWGSWLPWEPDNQPPFYRSQAGHFVDAHGLHILDPETGDDAKGWDSGIWGVTDNLSDCSFQNVGKHEAGRKLDGKTHDAFPPLKAVPA